MNKISIYVFLIILSGCARQVSTDLPDHVKDIENLTVYSAESEPERDIELVREQVFPSSDDLLLGDITLFAVDSQRRVYLADSQLLSIHVFDSDGNFITSVGRQGQGPGEFQDIYDMKIHLNQLYVRDYLQQRISVFSLDSFDLVNTIVLNPGNWNLIEELSGSFFPTKFFVIDSSTILLKFSNTSQPDGEVRYDKYYLMNDNGEIISGLIVEERAHEYLIDTSGGYSNLLDAPFNRHSLLSVSEGGAIYTAWTEDFLIRVYNSEGDYQRAFYYPVNKSSINKDYVISRRKSLNPNQSPAILQLIEDSYRNAEFPETWPALNNMFIDDKERLWVSVITENVDYYDWWVLSGEGQLLAKFPRSGKRLDRNLRELESIFVKDDFFYVLETQPTTGFEELVRYRIEM